ncbi:MAG: PAC2 family protein, partial [Candidatus Hydrogenedentota bacterium]
IPHTRNPVFWSSTTSEEMRDFVVRHSLSPTNYEGPASFGTFLAVEAKKRGLEMATVVAAIPSYVDGRNVRCIEAAAQKIVDLLGIHLDMDELHSESQAWVKGVSKLVGKRKDLAEQIRKLEEFYDNQLRSNTTQNETGANNDDLRSWFQRQNLKLE